MEEFGREEEKVDEAGGRRRVGRASRSKCMLDTLTLFSV